MISLKTMSYEPSQVEGKSEVFKKSMFREPSHTSVDSNHSKERIKSFTRYGTKRAQSQSQQRSDGLLSNGISHNMNETPNKTNPQNLKDPAIATVLTTRDSRYVHCFLYFLKSLEATGFSNEVILLIADGRGTLQPFLPPSKRDNSQSLSLPFQYNGKVLVHQLIVPTIEISNHFDGQSRRYSKMLSKLFIWSLYEYSRIVYYDLDFIFLRNPFPAVISDCDRAYFLSEGRNEKKNNKTHDKPMLCATVDEGMTKNFGKPAGTYFNCGFMVVQPNLLTFNWLISKRAMAERRQFVEQDMLNELFARQWHQMSLNYNVMHLVGSVHGDQNSRKILSTSTVVAIHEKFWILQEHFKDPSFLWNQNLVN